MLVALRGKFNINLSVFGANDLIITLNGNYINPNTRQRADPSYNIIKSAIAKLLV